MWRSEKKDEQRNIIDLRGLAIMMGSATILYRRTYIVQNMAYVDKVNSLRLFIGLMKVAIVHLAVNS
jgi:hypothetical protein